MGLLWFASVRYDHMCSLWFASVRFEHLGSLRLVFASLRFAFGGLRSSLSSLRFAFASVSHFSSLEVQYLQNETKPEVAGVTVGPKSMGRFFLKKKEVRVLAISV